MAINFPSSPTTGDTFTADNKTWEFNGVSWDIVVSTVNIADGSITQAKLAANVSAVTVTTTANKGTDVPSPFTGQLVFLTDTKKIQVWDGTSWLNITLAPPETPTSLSATALSTTSVSIAFTPGGANGSPITNYKYATSADNVTYSAYSALDPADTTSPITISGLTQNTSYYIKLKAVNDMGDSVESAAVTVTTLNTFDVDYLVVAGGGGAGGDGGGGAGAGGMRSTVTASGGTPGTIETVLAVPLNTNIAVTVGAGGGVNTIGSNSIFSTITSIGGGRGGGGSAGQTLSGGNGGSGGASQTSNSAAGTGTANQGFNAGTSSTGSASGGGGGAGGAGGSVSSTTGGNGGVGVASSITGSSVTYAGGGGGYGNVTAGQGGSSIGGTSGICSGAINATSGAVNTGSGGGGGGCSGGTGGLGGSGVVVLRYADTRTITVGAGLTASHTNASAGAGYKYTRLTAGSGNVSWA